MVMLAAAVLVAIVSGCGPIGVGTPPPLVPGTSAHPREVNLIARDYLFEPPALDLRPGETILLHVINAGLEVHEAVIGDPAVQSAWELAEAATATHPPGETPTVSVPPSVAGLRIVVASGQRVDIVWTVPIGAEADPAGWLVGCHIPGHYARGMVIPVRFGVPGASRPPSE